MVIIIFFLTQNTHYSVKKIKDKNWEICLDFPIFLIIFVVSKQLKALIMEIQNLNIGDWVRYKKSKETIIIFGVDADRGVINNESDGYCGEKKYWYK